MSTLIGCALTHILLMNLLPSPWWVPNMTLVGCTLALSRSPRQWLLYSTVAGSTLSVWAIRSPGFLLLSYVLYGGSVAIAARHWDIADRRIQGLLVGFGSLGMTLTWLVAAGSWSWALLGLASTQVAITVLTSVGLSRRHAARVRGAGGTQLYAMR